MRSSAIDTVRMHFPRGGRVGEGKPVIRLSYASFQPRSVHGIPESPSRLRLSIPNRISLNLNKRLAHLHVRSVRLHGNFDRTLTDAVGRAATICALMRRKMLRTM